MVSWAKNGKWRFLIKEDSSSAFRCNKTASRCAKSKWWIKNFPGVESEGNRLIMALLCFTATSRQSCRYRSSPVMYGFNFGKLKPSNSSNSYVMPFKKTIYFVVLQATAVRLITTRKVLQWHPIFHYICRVLLLLRLRCYGVHKFWNSKILSWSNFKNLKATFC